MAMRKDTNLVLSLSTTFFLLFFSALNIIIQNLLNLLQVTPEEEALLCYTAVYLETGQSFFSGKVLCYYLGIALEFSKLSKF